MTTFRPMFASVLLAVALALISPLPLLATPDYARQSGSDCRHCHVDSIGGRDLTGAGEEFLLDLKARGQYRPLSMTQHVVRLIMGYLHLMAAIVWFGTIMYVHILLKPAYASKGLPKAELRLGWLSMVVLLITGVLLTIARTPSGRSLCRGLKGISNPFQMRD